MIIDQFWYNSDVIFILINDNPMSEVLAYCKITSLST